MEWHDRKFSELSVDELYLIYQLRADVFNGEQKCITPDPDPQDRTAHHVFAIADGQVISYARYFTTNDQEVTFGRVVIAADHRHEGLGKVLMQHVLVGIQQNSPGLPIVIHAQYQVQGFYRQLGFQSQGEPFMEAERKHILMTHPAM